jgi:hypothetical protein
MPRGFQILPLTVLLLVNGLGQAGAEDKCLPEPNARAPKGSHWYYRTDPTSHNKCWHLREQGPTGQAAVQSEKPTQSETAGATAFLPPLPKPAPARPRPAVANSRQAPKICHPLTPSQIQPAKINPSPKSAPRKGPPRNNYESRMLTAVGRNSMRRRATAGAKVSTNTFLQ